MWEFSKRLRDKLGSRLVTVLLYGSKARGDYKADSDTDIFILTKRLSVTTLNIIVDVACDIEQEFDVYLTPVVFDLFEQERDMKIGSTYFKSISHGGVVL